MAEDPDAAGVDFVEDDGRPGPGPEEDLPQQPTARAAWRPRAEQFLRGRYGLPAVVVLAVLALLVGRAVLHDPPAGAPAPSGTPTPSGSGVTLDAGTGRAVVDLPRRTGADPTRCPGLQCYAAASVPAAVRAAVRAVFPAATVTAAETIRLVDHAHGDPLWYREVVARTGGATLTLRVQAHSAQDVADGGASDDGAQSVSFVDAASQQWFVRARMSGTSGSGDVLDQLDTLAADQRLLATRT